MNGLVRRAATLLGGAAVLLGGAGCTCGGGGGAGGDHQTYRDYVDPCYPERYNDMARAEVNADFAPQVLNGEVLDQTVWVWFFDPGTDKLTPGGLDQLAYIARRRPMPDVHVFLQTASVEEVGGYDPENPDKLVTARNALNAKRTRAVERFLTAQTAGRGIVFQVAVHDPAEVGLSGIAVDSTMQQMLNTRFRGGLQSGGGGGGGANVTGGAGAGAGAGGAPGAGTPR